MDYLQIIKDSFLALKDRSNLKYLIFFFLATLIYIISYLVIVFALSRLLPKGPVQIAVIPVFILLFFTYLLFIAYLCIRIMLKALRHFGLGTAQFGFVKFVKVIVLWVVQGIAVSLCLFTPLFLLLIPPIIVLVIAAVFIDMLIVKVLAALLAAFLAIPYMIAVIYNSLRLLFALPVFLSKDIGIIDSLRESWKITKGNVLRILIALILMAFLIWALSMGISLIMLILGIIIAIIIMAIATLLKVGILFVALFALLYVIYMVIMLLWKSCMFLIQIFYQVAIYSSLLGKGAAPKPEVKKPKQAPLSPRREAALKRASEREQIWLRKEFGKAV